MPDMVALKLAKNYTNTQVASLASGIKSMTNTGSQLIITLNDNSILTVTLTGLSDTNFTTTEKNKLASLNDSILNLFTYVNGQLLFNNQPISNGTVDLSNYYNKTEVNDLLSNKVSVNGTKQLSTEDYTTAEKTKVSGIADNATKVESSLVNGNIKINNNEVTVFTQSQSDWNEADNTKSSYINNKPNIPSKTSEITNDSNYVVDANYIHTDNNYSDTEKAKVQAMTNSNIYIGLFPTLTERNAYGGTLVSGYWCTIETDSDYSNKKTKYYYNGTQWIYDGTYQDASFSIDDTSTTSTSVGWSANKINTELGLKANSSSIPTKTSQLTNDSNYATTIDVNAKANSSDVYTQTQTNNLLLNKANSIHNHSISDVTNLQTNLDKKLETTNLIAGSNISLSVSGNSLTINASGGSGSLSYSTNEW